MPMSYSESRFLPGRLVHFSEEELRVMRDPDIPISVRYQHLITLIDRQPSAEAQDLYKSARYGDLVECALADFWSAIATLLRIENYTVTPKLQQETYEGLSDLLFPMIFDLALRLTEWRQ